jgi:hypothetical protein
MEDMYVRQGHHSATGAVFRISANIILKRVNRKQEKQISLIPKAIIEFYAFIAIFRIELQIFE